MDGVRSYTHPRTVYFAAAVAVPAVPASRRRPRGVKPLPYESSTDYRTQEVALSGHTAVAPPSIPGLNLGW